MICGEASYLATGYAAYTYEICKRLHKMGLDVIEFAGYGSKTDPRCNMPWKFFGCLPENAEEKKIYESNQIHQFGGYKFEKALLEHKPDVVFSMRDVWMDTFQITSPFRRFYKLFWMPTVDSEPQPSEWVSQYEQCDGIFTYSKWAENHLRTLSNKINYLGQASPGADFAIYKPQNKQAIRQHFNIPQDAFVIGTTMRNQKRKLFPNLIQAFDKLLDIDSNLREKAYLYCHTSWPDNGWNIPELVKNSKYASRILFTYYCKNCNAIYSSTFAEAIGVCKSCGNFSAVMPTAGFGVPKEALSAIYNIFDIYVQFAIAEGFGVPLVEAAACEIPIMGTDYSAIQSIIQDCGGYPIKVRSKHLDCEKQTYFAIPDSEDFIDKVRHFYNLPEHEKIRKRTNASKGVFKHYNYDDTAKKLYNIFSQVKSSDWSVAPDIRTPNPQPPQTSDINKLVEWAIINILGRPDLVGSFFSTRILRDLHNGVRMGGYGGPTMNDMAAIGYRLQAMEYKPNDMLNEIAHMRANINHWEQTRAATYQ